MANRPVVETSDATSKASAHPELAERLHLFQRAGGQRPFAVQQTPDDLAVIDVAVSTSQPLAGDGRIRQ